MKKPCDAKLIGRKIELKGRTVVVQRCPKCKEIIVSYVPTGKSKKYIKMRFRLSEEGAVATAQLLLEALSDMGSGKIKKGER